jgi:hypothetical protein
MSYPKTLVEKIAALKMIASKKVIGSANKIRFVEFGTLFWGGQGKNMDPSYAEEWAGRFNKMCEYIYADKETTRYLIKVDGMESARKRLINQYKSAGWSLAGIKEQMEIRGM